jgi:hypothetical protein
MKLILSFGQLFILLIAIKPVYAQSLTFERDIAPIVHKKCTPCHRPNEAAPFSLITYEDLAKRASFIKDVVTSRFMPPWKPDNSYVHYANDRSLTQEEISKIVSWINNKTPRGKSEKAKNPNVLVEGTSYGRKPDLVLKASTEYTLPGDNVERFIIYKIPFDLEDSANIEAVEFFCNNKKLIHHANYAVHEVPAGVDIDSAPEMINLTESDRSEVSKYQPFRQTITYYGGWIPGSSYETYPSGIGWIMPKRGVILLTVHYSSSATDETSSVGVNLFFTKTSVKRKVKVISFGSGGIGEQEIDPPLLIPPNSVRTYTLKVKNPAEDFSLMYVWPHMHLLGKSFLSYGITPTGDTIRLTSVPEWDFRWQEIYKFKKLVKFPKGTDLVIKGTYDNTINNPFNPNYPPRLVYSGGDMRSKDEMLTLMLVYLPYQEGDENISLTSK